MHSDGRGEESPDAYRGVVLPSVQHQPPAPYGDEVQPAGGSPWGAPAPAAPPPVPEAADATQMLPPYPGGMPLPGPNAGPGQSPGPPGHAPAPFADATQMLPPYPGGDPAGPPSPRQAAGPGPVPPLPPIPPQAPHQAPGAQQQPPPHQSAQPPARPAPAESTQALPLSIFQERQPYEPEPSYDQPSYNQPSYNQPGYDQYPQPQQGHEQGPAQGYGGYEQPQAPGPQHDSDYDHLFRADVPSPPQLRQRIIQPPSRQSPPQQQSGQQPYGQGAGRPPYGGQGPGQGQGPQSYAYDDDDAGHGGGRRMSPKVLIGIVVAGCVVAGLVVGGLLNSGGSASADNPDNPDNAADKSSAPAAGPSASASAAATPGDSVAKQQAQSLDALLKTSGNSRSSVVNAVESIKNCKDLPAAAADLRSAAGQRNGLVTRLGTLPVDQLPNHAGLTDALTKAWHASAAADGHYASWADQAQHNQKVCKGGHARVTDEAQAANRESGTATQQKKRAVRLWNAIAKEYGLTQRQYSQL